MQNKHENNRELFRGKSDATDTMQKQINVICNRFNFANMRFVCFFLLEIDENSKVESLTILWNNFQKIKRHVPSECQWN